MLYDQEREELLKISEKEKEMLSRERYEES
jgi:hypothetical protein